MGIYKKSFPSLLVFEATPCKPLPNSWMGWCFIQLVQVFQPFFMILLMVVMYGKWWRKKSGMRVSHTYSLARSMLRSVKCSVQNLTKFCRRSLLSCKIGGSLAVDCLKAASSLHGWGDEFFSWNVVRQSSTVLPLYGVVRTLQILLYSLQQSL